MLNVDAWRTADYSVFIDPLNVGKLKCLFKEKTMKYGDELLFKSNISSNDINSIAPKNTFLYNVLKAWSVINEKYNPTRNNIGKTISWNNSIINVDKKTVFYGSWYEQGISNAIPVWSS